MPYSKPVEEIAKVLKEEGYLDDVKKENNTVTVKLTFMKKEPVLLDLKLVSKPGLRIYMGVSELESKIGPSFFVISTPNGMMSSRKAIKKRLGGEVVAEVL